MQNPILSYVQCELQRLWFTEPHNNLFINKAWGGTERKRRDEVVIRHIAATIDRAIKILTPKGEPLWGLAPDELEFNVPFWTQMLFRQYFGDGSSIKTVPTVQRAIHTKAWDILGRLRIDDPRQIEYPIDPKGEIPFPWLGRWSKIVSMLPNSVIIRALISNYSEIWRQFREYKIEWDNAMKEWKGMVILSNHSTWANLPFIAHYLREFLGVDPKDIFIVIWPAITTDSFNLTGMSRFANGLKTVPDTDRWDIAFPSKRMIRANFSKALRQKLSEWKIILIAPSGTTDKTDRHWLLSMARPSKGTMALLQRLVNEWHPQWMIGSDERRVFGGNIWLKRWPVRIWIWSITHGKNMVDILPSLVPGDDPLEDSIGKWNEV